MKIAVITAIFGDMEQPKPFCPQSVPCDRIVVTEQNSPFPLPNLPPRLQAKYFKLQPHRVWPQYDVFVWIDGNIEVKDPDFVKVMTENLSGIRIQRHHERQTIGEEIAHILASDNPYVTTRYGNQPLKQEYEYYLSEGMPEGSPLYSCNIFAFENDDKKIGIEPVQCLFFNRWWDLVLRWSWFDQSAFSYLAWVHRNEHPTTINSVNLGQMFDNPYFILHPHDKWQQ